MCIRDRIRRIARIYDLTDAKAKDIIHKTDKKRASYYNYYSSKKWGEAAGYNLSVDSGILGVEGAVKMILDFVEIKESTPEPKL